MAVFRSPGEDLAPTGDSPYQAPPVTGLLLRVVPWLLLLGVAWFGGCEYQKGREAQNQIDALVIRNAYLEDRVGVVDTVYDTDTVAITKTRWRTDSVLTVDTLIHRDTVRVLVARERAACDQALTTCELRVAYRDSIIANLDSVIELQKKRGGNWKSKLGWLLAGGAAATIILTR